MTDFDPEQITQTILNRDAFYRILQRGNPPEIYQDISDTVRQSLSFRLSKSVKKLPLSEERFGEISSLLLIESWQEVLDEVRITELAINAQQYSLGTPSFQKAIDILFRAIILSHRLNRKPKYALEEEYREAQNILQLWLCKKIHKFNPSRGRFMGWINFNFDKNHIPEATDLKRKQKLGQKVDDYDFDRLSSPLSIDPHMNLVKWLQEDYIFRIPNRDKPHITFLDIALARAKNIGWTDIADQFGFNVHSTPSNFLKNWLKNLSEPLCENRPQSSLYAIRLSRYGGDSWSRIAQRLQSDESQLKAKHLKKLKHFPSYRDVTSGERYEIGIPDNPQVTFSKVATVLLEEGYVWREPSLTFKIDSLRLQNFYLSSLKQLWPNTEFSADFD